MSPFDIVNHLNKKTSLEFDIKSYLPFIINKSLSFHPETIQFANAMNMNYSLDSDIQYTFYKEGIPKSNTRFGKWIKKQDVSSVVEFISRIYNVNEKVASQYISLLNEEQLKQLCEKFGEGGSKYGDKPR